MQRTTPAAGSRCWISELFMTRIPVFYGTTDDPPTQRDLAAVLERFVTRTRWRPALTTHVAGALPLYSVRLAQRWMMRRIARRAGGGTDTTRDYEYTDWDELSRFVVAFEQLVAGTRA
jgi:menaquinone-dependent protoporphyrinogen oxidase